jgi:two-component system nitrogen regulation response regulator GlnG
VRELRNAVFRLALMARDETIDRGTVEDTLPSSKDIGREQAGNGFEFALAQWFAANRSNEGNLYHSALAAFEKPLFERVLADTQGNQIRAAQRLGINRNTLRKRLSELSISPEAFARPR